MKKIKSFNQLLKIAPFEIILFLEGLKNLRERPDFHPEKNCFIHIKIVTERLITTGDIDLILAGLFHDIGKKVCSEISEKTGFPTAPLHDKFGAKKVMEHEFWIRSLGGNPELISQICEQHMRAKTFDEMSKKKQNKLKAMPCWDKLQIFLRADSMLTDWPTKNPFVNLFRFLKKVFNGKK